MPNTRRIRTIWIWIVFFLLSLFLLSSNLAGKRSWNPGERLIIETTAPFQKLITKTIDGTESIWKKYFALVNVEKENLLLGKEIAALRMENDRYQELLASYERLQKLLQFKKTTNWPVLPAQVIGRDPTGWFKSVIIDKGENSGLKVNMPVVDVRGVVGRLVSVSSNYAKVLLIIDQNSAVDSIIQGSRETGIVKGVSSKICKLAYVVKTVDVRVGDMVVTSGLGRVYPKGLPVGKIVEVVEEPGALFKDIKVKPMVDFSKLEELLVVLKEDPLLTPQKKKD